MRERERLKKNEASLVGKGGGAEGRKRRACGPVVRLFLHRLSHVLAHRFNFDLQPDELIEM